MSLTSNLKLDKNKLISALFMVLSLTTIAGYQSGSFLAYLFLYGLSFVLLFVYRKPEHKRNWLMVLVAFMMCCSMFVFGTNLWNTKGGLPLAIVNAVLVLPGAYITWENILVLFEYGLQDCGTICRTKRFNWKLFAGVTGIFLGIWLCLWWLLYPGIANPDTVTQYMQLEVGKFNNHHPYMHTLLLGFIRDIAFIFEKDNYVLALGLYTLFQVIVGSIIVGYSVACIDRVCKFSRLGIYILCAFWVILLPVDFMMVNAVKDSMQALALMLLTVELFNYFSEDSHPWYRFVLLFISSVFVMFFKSIGIYIYLPLLLMAGIMDWRRCWALVVVGSLVWGVCAYHRVTFENTLDNRELVTVSEHRPEVDAETYSRIILPDDSVERLCIPIQQVGYVVSLRADVLDEEDIAILEKIAPIEKIRDLYEPGFVDTLKSLIRKSNYYETFEQDKSEVIKLWLSLGRKYPRLYVRAWADLVGGYVAPVAEAPRYNLDSPDNCYALRAVHEDTLLFYIIKGGAFLIRHGYFPVVTVLSSSCIFVWFLILCLYKGLRCWSVPFVLVTVVPLMSVFALLMATPVSNYFRYVCYLYLSVPLVFVALVMGKRMNKV